ncbi:hypothetical protein [Rubrimonas cliftonensis]|uniref:SMP-30/Gluconolaconase/LRE-like region-containing protein n=1 Tax=Rubrimonas cliftonensis TaxID=89524 RepID=A0A1H4GB31_9RHOB|nr:hypothetical protein [Rubrimonas cliftonensis]SEB06809.1 hypothetical protein SAMN05444370_1485 [Rubrimonas cliftonensis]
MLGFGDHSKDVIGTPKVFHNRVFAPEVDGIRVYTIGSRNLPQLIAPDDGTLTGKIDCDGHFLAYCTGQTLCVFDLESGAMVSKTPVTISDPTPILRMGKCYLFGQVVQVVDIFRGAVIDALDFTVDDPENAVAGDDGTLYFASLGGINVLPLSAGVEVDHSLYAESGVEGLIGSY